MQQIGGVSGEDDVRHKGEELITLYFGSCDSCPEARRTASSIHLATIA
jgi:hypothetical protein